MRVWGEACVSVCVATPKGCRHNWQFITNPKTGKALRLNEARSSQIVPCAIQHASPGLSVVGDESVCMSVPPCV